MGIINSLLPEPTETSNLIIIMDEFNDAVRAAGFKVPPRSIWRAFDYAIKDDGFSRRELAMFLAQLIHESGGFQFKEELAFKNKRNHGEYVDNVGLPSRDYHGRGFIQLTWGRNYKAASNDLGMGDRLLRDPHLVAEDDEIAMQVSVWYWTTVVRPALAGRKNDFGVTTNAINGAIECGRNRPRHPKAVKRYQIYRQVAEALEIRNPARENGCYN